MPVVYFVKQQRAVECPVGANLRAVARRDGIDIYVFPNNILNCRGNGLCGTCVMEVVEGLDHLSAKTRRELVKLNGQPANRRLSCQCRVMGDIVCVTAAALD